MTGDRGRRRIDTPRRDERGFTLIELSIVVIVLAVLLAVAVPTFLGFRRFSQDRAAQSNLRTAYTNAKVLFTDELDFRDATPSALAVTETSLDFEDADQPSARPRTISVNPLSAVRWVAVARSESGTCFALVAGITEPATRYGRTTSEPCRADEPWAVGASDAAW